MREFLVCDMCTATVSTDSAVCDFCGSDFKYSGTSGDILKLKDEIEKMILRNNISELINKINKSKFKDHPIILYRKAKALLIEYMTNDGVIDAEEFIEVIQIINNISRISNDYWTEFVLYLTILLPSSRTKLKLDDYKTIRNYLLSINRDDDKVIQSRMIQQILISEAGETFFKEYIFYNDQNNFIDNKDFIQKKNYLQDKYLKLTQSINKQLDNN